MQLTHHGGHRGVTGSCHQLEYAPGRSLLVDCGLFQGRDAKGRSHEIDFSLDGIGAVVLTHAHIDHVGRLPYLLAAGYEGPLLCSHPTARLLPLVLEDALRLGFTRKRWLVDGVLEEVGRRLQPLDYNAWHDIDGDARVRLQRAGHILGSAYVEVDAGGQRVVFSGDLGAPHTPLLYAPRSPARADLLVLESTYGDRVHEGRQQRRQRLRDILEHTLVNGGATIVPAFSLGRTQELLYEIDRIFAQLAHHPHLASRLREVDVIVDSPLASRFTQAYEDCAAFWDAEARQLLQAGDQPLVFDNLMTVADHDQHRWTVDYLKRKGSPAIVIAGSGMCTGGRVVNYLKSLLGDERTDVLFVGYQGAGTPGRVLQGGAKSMRLDGKRVQVRARVHSLSGYSAHADQASLLRFVRAVRRGPERVVLVHGEASARRALAAKLGETGVCVVG